MAKKVPFPPDSPKQCPCGHKHISWSADDDHIFCWDCNRRYPLLACFRPPEREISDSEKTYDQLDPDEIKRVKVQPVKCPRCNLTILAKLGDGLCSVCGDGLLAATK